MNETDAVVRSIEAFVEAVNLGRMDVVTRAFNADAVIIEDIPPFRWQGPGAAGQWLAAMGENAGQLGVTEVAMELGAPLQLRVAESRAYAAYPGTLRLTKSAAVAVAGGQLVFTLAKSADRWSIESLAWSGPEPR